MDHLDEKTPRWFAVHTKFKSEKVVQRLLNQKGVVNYLPLQRLTRRYGRRISQVEIPLISCYLFVNITKKHYLTVLETEFVVNFVRFFKRNDFYSGGRIELLQRIVGEGIDIYVEKTTFYEGDEVQIAKGNLTGLKGKLVSVEGKNRFLVEFDNLGYTLQLSVEKDMIMAI